MPRGKVEKLQRLPAQIYADIWDAVSWIDLASEARPENRFVRTGQHIKGLCPFHEESGASFQITPAKRMAKCFGCGKFVHNPIHLVATLLRVTYSQALVYLKALPGVRKLLPQAFIEASEKFEKHQRLKAEVIEFCCGLLFKFMTSPREEVARDAPWALETVDWLASRIPLDNVFPVLTANQLVGILPPLNVFEQDPEFCGKEEAVKFASEYFKDHIVNNYQHVGSLMLITHLDPGSIGRVKLRKPGSLVVFVKDDEIKEETLGFFGMRYYKQYFGSQGAGIAEAAYLHEGEFDAMHTIAHHVTSGDDFIALACGGGAAPSADQLVPFGIKSIYIVPDDDKGGIHFTQTILGKSRSKDLSIKIFEWPERYRRWSNPANPDARIKDADEAIHAFGYATWEQDVQNAANYREPHEWAWVQLERSVSKLSEADLAEHSRLAKDWGRYLHNPQECRRYCKQVAKNYNLDENILYREISAANEDEQGFIHRVKEALLTVYSVHGFTSNGSSLVVWHTQRRHQVILPLDKLPTLEARLAQDLGPAYRFVREHVGDASFLSSEDAPSTLQLRALNQRYLDYIRLALLEIAETAGPIDEANMKRQGFHFVAGSEGADRGYLLNGADLWRMSFAEEQMTAELLPAVRDGALMFEGDDAKTWLPTLRRPEQLTAAELDLHETYEAILEMIQTGWRFRQQAVDCQFLAAYVMGLPIADVFPRQTSIWLTGNAGSGKSRFISGLISGFAFPDIQLVAASQGLGVYTAAGVRQTCAGCTFALVLDEFEDDGSGDKRSKDTKAVLRMLYDQLTSHAGGKAVYGSASGRARGLSLRFPVVVAAIHPVLDEAALSRFVIFEMAPPSKGEAAIRDPRDVLIERWGASYIDRLRRALGLGMFRHVPAMRKAYSEIGAVMGDPKALPAEVTTRFREAMYSVLAVRKVLGLDYRRFAEDFAGSRLAHLGRTLAVGAGSTILDDLLDARIVEGEERASTSLRKMLAKVGELDAINRVHCGAYLDLHKRWLVVNWIGAQAHLLQWQPRYRDSRVADLVTRAERAPQFVPFDEVERFHVLDRLAEWMGYGVNRKAVSVFNVGPILEAAMAADAARRQPAPSRPLPPPSASRPQESVESGDDEGV